MIRSLEEKTMKKDTAITCVFWMSLGHCLPEVWGHQSRAAAMKTFHLNQDEMQERHYLNGQERDRAYHRYRLRGYHPGHSILGITGQNG
jgi:hypothetical protein